MGNGITDPRRKKIVTVKLQECYYVPAYRMQDTDFRILTILFQEWVANLRSMLRSQL
jgi:hypothetical protein